MSDTHTNHEHEPAEAVAALCHTCKHCGLVIEAVHCKECDGTGIEAEMWIDVSPCPECNGTGIEKWMEVKP